MKTPIDITGYFHKNSELRMSRVFIMMMVVDCLALGYFLVDGLLHRDVYHAFVVHNPVISGFLALVVIFMVLYPVYRYRETRRRVKVHFTCDAEGNLSMTLWDNKPLEITLPAYSMAGTVKETTGENKEKNLFRFIIWLPDKQQLVLDEKVPEGVTPMKVPDIAAMNVQTTLHYTGIKPYPGPVEKIVSTILSGSSLPSGSKRPESPQQ